MGKTYKQYITSYGLYSVLLTLDYFEETENFEECSKIINAIKSMEVLLDIKLPKNSSNALIKEVLREYKDLIDDAKLIELSTNFSKIIINSVLNDGINYKSEVDTIIKRVFKCKEYMTEREYMPIAEVKLKEIGFTKKNLSGTIEFAVELGLPIDLLIESLVNTIKGRL